MKKLILLVLLLPLALYGQQSLQLPFSVKVLNPYPLDAYYYNASRVFYTSTSQVTSEVVSSVRYRGQTFNVAGVEYWFKDGIADGDLVIKLTGGGGVSTFTALTDGPGSYTGRSLNLTRVNVGETGLEYQTLAQVKSNMSLNLVDNTSDVSKPVSTAQQVAINAKQDLLISGTNIKTVGGTSLLGSGNISVGTGTVTNVSSADGNATVATQSTTPVITIVSAPKMSTGRTIGITGDVVYTSPAFDGSGDVTASANVVKINGSNVPANSSGALTNNGTGVLNWNPASTYYGSILNQTSFSGTTGYTDNGASPSVVSSALQFTGGTNVYTQTLDYNYITCLEYVSVTGTFKVEGTISSTSYGFFIGKKTTNPSYSYSNYAAFDMTNGASAGKIKLVDGAGAQLTISTTGITFSVNDIIELNYTQTENVYTVTARNITTNTDPISLTYTYLSNPPGSILPPNTSKIVTGKLGGTYSLTALSIFSNEIKNADVMLIGDSKLEGYRSSIWQNRIGGLLRTNVASVVVNSGGGDRTAEVLSRISEIIALNPKKVLLGIGSNDVRSGVSSATYLANYDAIASALIAAGIDVYHLLPFREYTGGISQTIMLAHINATYSAAKIIDTYSVLTPGLVDADGVHENDAGTTALYNKIISSGALSSSIRPPFVYVPNLYSTSTGIGIFQSAPTTPLHITQAANSGKYILMENTTTTSGAFSGISFKVGSTSSFIYQTPATYTISAFSDAMVIQSSTSKPIIFNVGGNTVDMKITPGAIGIGGVTTPTDPLQVTSSANSGKLISIENTSVGTSAFAGFKMTNGTTSYIYQTGGTYLPNASFADALVLQSTTAKPIILTSGGSSTDLVVRADHTVGVNSSLYVGSATTAPTSTLQSSGSFAAGYIAKTANYTLTSSDRLVNCTSGSFTITLPTAVGCAGREYIIKNTGSATTITIATTSSQTIDGSAPGTVISLTPLRVVSDGANWITY